MGILKLKPATKSLIWGGRRLIDEYSKETNGENIAETWELSCHKDGPSVIENGEFKGKTLREYLDTQGWETLGTNCERFDDFPILVKFIDANDKLSIQVHPDNEYAQRVEGQYGKTEMWYVMDAKEGAYLYYGFKENISREEYEERIKNDTLLEVLNAVKVKKGDVLFIEAGTIHAICEGILIAEIQQNSNVTYRVYDYGRKGADGLPRELHIEKALDVTNRGPAKTPSVNAPHIADCEYFTVDKLLLKNEEYKDTANADSFVSLLIMDGAGTIENGAEKLDIKKGDSLFLPALSGNFSLSGSFEALLTRIGK